MYQSVIRELAMSHSKVLDDKIRSVLTSEELELIESDISSWRVFKRWKRRKIIRSLVVEKTVPQISMEDNKITQTVQYEVYRKL